MKKRRSVVFLSVVAAMFLGGTAWAAHNTFTDVPDDHRFFTGVEWAVANGITVGCNSEGDEFCPDRPVTRGQMVTFLKRYYDNVDKVGGNVPIGLGISGRSTNATPFSGNGVVADLALDLNIPISGVLIVNASAETENTDDPDAFACGINTGGSASLAQADSWRTIDLRDEVIDTCATQTALQVSPGSATARLVIVSAVSTTKVFGGNISAVLYPDVGSFGLLGGPEDQVTARSISDSPPDK